MLEAPVGERWWDCRKHRPELELYAEDGAHQTLLRSIYGKRSIQIYGPARRLPRHDKRLEAAARAYYHASEPEKKECSLQKPSPPAQKLSHVEQKPAIPCPALKNRVPHRKKQVSPWWNTSGMGWLLFHLRSTWGQQKTQKWNARNPLPDLKNRGLFHLYHQNTTYPGICACEARCRPVWAFPVRNGKGYILHRRKASI